MRRCRVSVLEILAIAGLPFIAGCGGNLDAGTTRLVLRAEEAFAGAKTTQDFLRVAGLYQEVLDRGVVSGAVWYNQGNALVRAGQRGRAIAAYRQAMRYRPRDPYLEANLRSALGSSGGTARRPMIEYVLFWQDWLSYPEKFAAAIGAAIAAFLLGLAGLFTERRGLARLATAGLLVVLILGLSATYDWYRYDCLTHGVIVERQTVARKGNAQSYEPALTGALVEGTEFTLLEDRAQWLLIRLAGGQEGWVPQQAAVTY
jgi:hypothetical protein